MVFLRGTVLHPLRRGHPAFRRPLFPFPCPVSALPQQAGAGRQHLKKTGSLLYTCHNREKMTGTGPDAKITHQVLFLLFYSTVTLLARFLGLSISQPRIRAAPRTFWSLGTPFFEILGPNELALRKFFARLRIYAPKGADMWPRERPHSTVTLLARFLGLSMSQPRIRAT